MTRRQLHLIVNILVLGVWFTHCGGSGQANLSSSSGTGGGSGTTSQSVVGGNVSALTASDSGLVTDLTDVQDDDEVMIVLYSYNPNSTAAGFEVSNDQIAADISGVSADDGAEEPETDIEGTPDITESLHEMLREAEADISDDAEAVRPRRSNNNALTSTTQSFKVLNSFSNSSSYTTVSATKRYETDDFEFYVDDRDAASLTDADLQTLATNYAAVIPRERELFGDESDVNGDGKFAVLFTHVVNELGGNSGGIVTGFFYAVDLFSDTQYAISNEREIFYTFVPDPTGQYGATISHAFALSNILPGVLPHEYQHMISFNQHYFLNGGAAETGWLNEGLSHLAEDIYTNMADTGLENPSRVASFLSGISNICFTCGTNLNQRGGSYLFVRYLYEQAENGNLTSVADGDALLHNLLDTNLRSSDNVIQAAFGSAGTTDDFKNVLGLFSLAIYLSNTDATTNNLLNFTGINLRSVQSDNRGTVLNGPAVQTLSTLPFTDTLTGNGMTYIQVPGSLINANGGSVSFSFDAAGDFGGYVVQ